MQHEQYQIRAEKRARLLREGNDPYPVELPVTSSIKEVRAKYADLEAGALQEQGADPDHTGPGRAPTLYQKKKK